MTTRPSDDELRKREEELNKREEELKEALREQEVAANKSSRQLRAPTVLEPDEIITSNPGDRPRKSGGGGVTPIMLVIGIVVAVIISIFYSNSNLVSKTDFTANTNNILTTVGQVQTDLKTAQTSITNAVNGIPSQVTSALGATNTKLTNDEGTLNTLQGNLTNLTNQLATLNTTSTNTATDVTAIKTQLATLSTLSSTVTALQNQLKTDEATIATLSTSVTALQTTTTTTTASSSGTSGTGTATNGQVSATIISYSVGNIYSSTATVLKYSPTTQPIPSPIVTVPNGYTAVLIGTSTAPEWMLASNYQQFTLQIANGTGKTISNIQIGLAFVFLNPTDGTQMSLPAGVTYSLSSMGNPQWTPTGNDPTYAAWATGTSNSIIGSLWNFSQPSGTTPYYCTLTINLPIVTASGTPLVIQGTPLLLSSQTWYAVPILKILSYTTG